MAVVWNENVNDRSEVQNIKLNPGDYVEVDFNTKLIPNDILLQVKKMEGQTYGLESFGKITVQYVLLLDNGNLTSIKFKVEKI